MAPSASDVQQHADRADGHARGAGRPGDPATAPAPSGAFGAPRPVRVSRIRTGASGYRHASASPSRCPPRRSGPTPSPRAARHRAEARPRGTMRPISGRHRRAPLGLSDERRVRHPSAVGRGRRQSSEPRFGADYARGLELPRSRRRSGRRPRRISALCSPEQRRRRLAIQRSMLRNRYGWPGVGCGADDGVRRAPSRSSRGRRTAGGRTRCAGRSASPPGTHRRRSSSSTRLDHGASAGPRGDRGVDRVVVGEPTGERRRAPGRPGEVRHRRPWPSRPRSRRSAPTAPSHYSRPLPRYDALRRRPATTVALALEEVRRSRSTRSPARRRCSVPLRSSGHSTNTPSPVPVAPLEGHHRRGRPVHASPFGSHGPRGCAADRRRGR